MRREREPVTVPRKTDPFTHSLPLTHSLTLSLQPGLAWSWPGLASLNRSYVSSRPSPPLLKAVLNGVFQFPLLHTHTHTQGKGIGMHRKEKKRERREIHLPAHSAARKLRVGSQAGIITYLLVSFMYGYLLVW